MTRIRAREVMKRAFLAMAWSCATLVVAGCTHESSAMESRPVSGLTAITYNYSDEVIVSVRVDGELAGTGMEAAQPGGLTSSGSSCCISLDPGVSTVAVEIKPASKDAYVVQGLVEQPWPEGAKTVIVHVLPGRKVVLETTLGAHNWPRRDLLEGRLKELGMKPDVEYDGPMNVGRNVYDGYMEVPE